MRPSLVATLVLLVATPAAAHFKLIAPKAMSQQNTSGDPQKTHPCGQDDQDDPWVPTSEVTTVRTGSTLTVTIDETVYHPGHYRVALARTMGELPADPPVTSTQQTACGSVPIETTPALPVLADGQLLHSSPFTTDKSIQVQLPGGMECENCILQVTEFMTNHGAPCFYYHCATVTISNSAPPPASDAGVTPDGGDTSVDDPGGCCGVGGGAGSSSLLALGVAALLTRRRAGPSRRRPSA
ncbi:MAG: SCE4755 family polysaccharide monooxygenase-like protein [Kofleriaceae bacterium]|nr:SCE4755 family polysaccharide monooxygenase-like protein [Kofleriaceae bacterium]